MTWPRLTRNDLLRSAARVRKPVSDFGERLLAWWVNHAPNEYRILLGFAVVTGVVTAFGVVVFYWLIDLAYQLFYTAPADIFPRFAYALYRPVVTGAGLALAWWIMRKVGRGHDGMNVPDIQLAVARRGGDVPPRPALARTLASAVTIGAGGSAGTEGPLVVVGATLSSWLGRVFRFASSRTTVLVGCGTGAAISAAFNAPLAGAFFALEEMVGTFSGASFAPVVVASVVAAVITRSIHGNHPAFPIPEEYGYSGAVEVLVFFPLLGVVCGVASAAFIKTYNAAGAYERRIGGAKMRHAWMAGGLVGFMVFLTDGNLVGFGHLAVHLDVFGRMAWYALAALAVAKIFATAVTLNFGGSGGVFTPSLFIGAAAGGALGSALQALLPSLGVRPETYALVGMGGLVAAATGAPITGILLVFEMTNDYAIVLPLMLVVVIAHMVSRALERDTLYTAWLRRRGERIEHGAVRDVLAHLRVADALNEQPTIIRESARLSSLLEQIRKSDQSIFPVVDEDWRLTGVITIADLGRVALDHRDLDDVLIAGDIARPSETVTVDASLTEAIRRMGLRGGDAIPVTESVTGRVVGLVTRGHVLSAYQRASASLPPPEL
jgi:chloride channel protein, CIC family